MSKPIEKTTRIFIVLFGIGIGAGLAALLLALLKRISPDLMKIPFLPVIVYGIAIIVCMLISAAVSYSVYTQIMRVTAKITGKFDNMPVQQIAMVIGGMIAGLVIAALITQLVLSVGPSLITVSFSSLIYIVLGYLGMQIANHQYQKGRYVHIRFHRHGKALPVEAEFSEAENDIGEIADSASEIEKCLTGSLKIMDSSVFFDGRILAVYRTGFLEGSFLVPQFVLTEMQHVADNADSQRRNKGRRGLDTAMEFQKLTGENTAVSDIDYPEISEVDSKLLRLCKEKGAALVTTDFNLIKVAKLSRIRVLNINELALAVKPAIQAGDELFVHVSKEGREPGQGLAYLEDGTMVVVENGKDKLDDDVTVVITSMLQTAAGRMVFAQVKEL